MEGVNNFVSLDFSKEEISTHPKHIRIQYLQGFVVCRYFDKIKSFSMHIFEDFNGQRGKMFLS